MHSADSSGSGKPSRRASKETGNSLDDLVRRIVNEELDRRSALHTVGLLPHTEWKLGTRRRCAALARSGRINGARRVGKLWMAPAASIEAFVAEAGTAPPVNDTDEIASIISRARGAR